jgi:hypothetical protein
MERVGKSIQMLTMFVYRYLGSWGNMGESSSSFAAIPFFPDDSGFFDAIPLNGYTIRCGGFV